MRTTPVAIGLMATLLASCGKDPATEQALHTFERFQDAIFARDAAAARQLVTRESKAVVDAMPWDDVAKRARLIPVEATDERGSFRVAVRDPSKPESRSDAYVVVREYGRFVVDLVATAGLYTRTFQTAGGPEDFELGELSPEDIDRARRMALEKPRDER